MSMLLLDSSVFLWSVWQSRRLGPHTRSLIEQANAVHVSSVSIAEMTIKSMIGKIDIPADLHRRLPELGLIELPLAVDHAAAIGEFPELVRHDPFDRLLVAQAFRTGMDLLTADRVLLGTGRDFILDATL
jgi:PIN domain nuclease of toxin-antitoxin system